jgi:hypothetical protein
MYGFDFVDRDTNPFPEDESDHGTAVAHILITSFMEKSHLNSLRIMSVRVASKNQVESTAVANGIMFALANNASIINISVSFPEETPELRNALRLAYEQNVPVVVSAGNFSTNMDVIPMYPASSVFPNIITVSALDTHGELSSYSNYGSAIDILATGESFIKSGHTGILKKYTGTSFSAAMVSGYLAAQESAGISNNEAFTSLDSTFVVQSGTEAKVLQYIP